jgi:hypothetical protein
MLGLGAGKMRHESRLYLESGNKLRKKSQRKVTRNFMRYTLSTMEKNRK